MWKFISVHISKSSSYRFLTSFFSRTTVYHRSSKAHQIARLSSRDGVWIIKCKYRFLFDTFFWASEWQTWKIEINFLLKGDACRRENGVICHKKTCDNQRWQRRVFVGACENIFRLRKLKVRRLKYEGKRDGMNKKLRHRNFTFLPLTSITVRHGIAETYYLYCCEVILRGWCPLWIF